MEPLNIIMTAVVGALTGLLVSFLNNKIDYRYEVRSDLWNKRFESYIRIWKLMQLIPLWPKNEKFTYKELYECRAFRTGITNELLSRTTTK